MSLKVAAEQFAEYCKQYAKEEDCIPDLFRLKWPDGFRCSRCGHTCYYLINTRRLPLYECKSCRHQSSLLTGSTWRAAARLCIYGFKRFSCIPGPNRLMPSNFRKQSTLPIKPLG
ncbi:transposase [Paenibacillaceae bacterium WGS1546]|uniref:transposase n=1 Tax=Cohnella sp. WGS1546 TaxID=3366810 RepID=UPI00372D5A29